MNTLFAAVKPLLLLIVVCAICFVSVFCFLWSLQMNFYGSVVIGTLITCVVGVFSVYVIADCVLEPSLESKGFTGLMLLVFIILYFYVAIFFEFDSFSSDENKIQLIQRNSKERIPIQYNNKIIYCNSDNNILVNSKSDPVTIEAFILSNSPKEPVFSNYWTWENGKYNETLHIDSDISKYLSVKRNKNQFIIKPKKIPLETKCFPLVIKNAVCEHPYVVWVFLEGENFGYRY